MWRNIIMLIKEISAELINPAPYNPRIDLRPGDVEYEKIKRSIHQFGYVEPLVWNEVTGHLVGGHQRFKILMEEEPVTLTVSVVNLDTQQERLLNIALNKVQGDWDEYKLSLLLDELNKEDIDLGLSGFDRAELDEILGGEDAEGDSKIRDDKEIDLSEYDDSFEHKCPKCGFYYND